MVRDIAHQYFAEQIYLVLELKRQERIYRFDLRRRETACTSDDSQLQ